MIFTFSGSKVPRSVPTRLKPILKVNLVPRPKRNIAFVGFTRVDNLGERNTTKEMLKSVRVEEWNKISIDETTKLIKSLPNMLRKFQKVRNSFKSINFWVKSKVKGYN
ncbi:hypothetical protein TNCV_1279361 [Trichonephila clavipes]|nr:hypothetical protein TNCV_1279361 [Trichonephila clavipes]